MEMDKLEVRIRVAEERDMDSLLEIYNDEVLHGTATFDLNPKTLEERKPWFYAHNVDNHPLLVAEAAGETAGEVAGYASLSPYREKEGYRATVELSVYIAAAYRGRGVATALIGAILEIARKREDIHTVVSVITAGNEASVRLHEKFDFIYCGAMAEVGEKFGKRLGTVSYQLMV